MNRVRISSGKIASSLLLLLACAFACLTFPGRSQTVPGQAEVRRVKGTALWSTNDSVPTALKAGAILGSGAVITTGTNSAVDLYLRPNAGVIRIAESSRLSLESLKVTETGADKKIEVQLELPDGEMYFNVNKLSKASRYEIKMPTGVAGIRGTKGSFNSRPGGLRPPILLLEGTVEFVPAQGVGPVVTFTLKAPPAVTFTKGEGIAAAPAALVQAVVAQVNSVTLESMPSQLPAPTPNTQQPEPVLTRH